MDKYDWMKIVGIIVGVVILDLILTIPAMLLWNYLMPSIFGLPTLTFWQTFGLEILASFFTSSYHTSGGNK